ncbi:MAG: glycosyltransferase [Candidatus Moranbacteria bacterium]|jgi:glycosyltransferase involved in cell wall biosynthesis|nr:glycosyltransferase [Candidatus Moranbacteria bacterium]
MKILFVIHQYWPKYQSGSENYTHYIAKAMADNGHDVFVLAVEPGSNKDYFIERNNDDAMHIIKIHKSLKAFSNFDWNYRDLEYEKIFKEILNEINPEIVHIQHLMYASLGITKIIKEREIPIIYTLHDLWLECLKITKLDHENKVCNNWNKEKCLDCYNTNHLAIKNKYLSKIANFLNNNLKGTIIHKFILSVVRKNKYFFKTGNNGINPVEERFEKMIEMTKDVDLFISPSKFLREEFIKWGIAEDKILYSRNGMNILNQDILNKDKFIEKKEDGLFNFVFTSQVREHKGIDVLLDAFKILEKNNFNKAKLFIFGGYDKGSIYGRKFKKRIFSLRNVKYRGSFKNSDINSILKDADYLILPSIWPENAPLVIDEAYLNNVPCIVSNIGGMAERVDNDVNGLHFKVGDANDLVEKIKYVIDNPQLREEFISKIPHVKTIDENVLELIEIYKKYINN